MKNYNKKPKTFGQFPIKVDEYFSYTYLPIKLRGEASLTNERRLSVFDTIIGRAACDFVGERGLDEFIDSYIYVTAKSAVQRDGSGFNRSGWHSDGFMTDDISYVWSNMQPTVFNDGDFFLTQDDQVSIAEMDAQALQINNFSYPNDTLIRMDQFSIHRVGEYEKGHRVFVKICFSKDKYALKGNSINYHLDYTWDYVERNKTRNIPQQLK